MTDRESTLQELVETLQDHEVVENAFVAKSFTDRLVVVDVQADATLPETVEASLRSHGLRGANAVYATDDTDRSFAGGFGGANRHQFVDMQTRGDHQSYVCD